MGKPQLGWQQSVERMPVGYPTTTGDAGCAARSPARCPDNPNGEMRDQRGLFEWAGSRRAARRNHLLEGHAIWDYTVRRAVAA